MSPNARARTRRIGFHPRFSSTGTEDLGLYADGESGRRDFRETRDIALIRRRPGEVRLLDGGDVGTFVWLSGRECWVGAQTGAGGSGMGATEYATGVCGSRGRRGICLDGNLYAGFGPLRMEPVGTGDGYGRYENDGGSSTSCES